MVRNEDHRNVIATAPPPPYDSVVQPPQNPYFESSDDRETILTENERLDDDNSSFRNNLPSGACYKQVRCCGLTKSVIILVFSVALMIAAASLTTFFVMTAYGNLKKYGTKCTPSVPMSCKTTDLICLDSGVCGCKSSDYKWEQQQELCIALVNSNAECRKWGWDGSYAVPCTENAVCNDNHRCECLPYYVEDEHECIASYDGICSSTKDCNQREFLVCGENGKCKCRPGTVRHQKGNALGCFVKIGETCAGNMRDLCVDPNSECSKEQLCRCNEDKGYIPSKENTSCGKTANNTCYTDGDCADTLSCLKTAVGDQAGVCYCRNTEVLNDVDGKCQIKAGQRCAVTNLKQCVKNASCKRSTCVCNHGWQLDELSGLCLGTHGTVCSTNGNCLGSHFFKCIEGTCGCDTNHTHFSETSGNCYGNMTDTACVNDLNCDQRRMVCNHQTKTCTCTWGYEEDNKSCYGTHGTGCAETSDCFSPQILSCIEGRCGCYSASEEWEENQCKLQFNQRCNEPGHQIDMKCVGNLTCLIDPTHTSDSFKLCGCEAKYVPSDDKRLCVNRATPIMNASAFAILFMFVGIKMF